MTRTSCLFLKLTAILVAMALCGCVPMKTGPYLQPSSTDREAHVHKQDCCGGVGPRNLMVTTGPKNVRYILVMQRFETGVRGRLAIDAPPNVKIDLTSRQVMVEDIRTSRRYPVDLEGGKLLHFDIKPWGVPTCPNIGMYYDRLPPEGTAFDRFTGSGKHGSRMLMNLHLPESPTGPFKLNLPEIIVDGLPFLPASIEFNDTEGDWEIYPINC